MRGHAFLRCSPANPPLARAAKRIGTAGLCRGFLRGVWARGLHHTSPCTLEGSGLSMFQCFLLFEWSPGRTQPRHCWERYHVALAFGLQPLLPLLPCPQPSLPLSPVWSLCAGKFLGLQPQMAALAGAENLQPGFQGCGQKRHVPAHLPWLQPYKPACRGCSTRPSAPFPGCSLANLPAGGAFFPKKMLPISEFH